jgi:dolichyl-diphosphooligosaccharide--protein glycosyltransferase
VGTVDFGKVRPKFIIGVIVALLFGFALFLRIYPPYGGVFVGDWVKFTGNDAYYQMYLVDNIIHNFPHLTTFSPYLLFPGGMVVGGIHFLNWLLAGITWLIGLGSPTEHTVDLVGVYFPAVLGALTVIPVYFIGKELFGRWAGVLAAAIIAIIPGEFLGRSILGFTDQHVAETLLTTVTMLFLILAIRRASQVGLSYSHLRRREWKILARPAIYSLLAGFFLGLYIFTWQGALLFVFISFLYFVVQFVIDHLRGKSTDYLGIVGGIFFLVSLIITLLISAGTLYLSSMLIALVIPPVLSVISRLMSSRGLKRVFYPAVVVGLGLAGVGILYAVHPSLVRTMWDNFTFVFAPSGASLTTMEMQSIFKVPTPGGNFFDTAAWGNFYINFFFSIIALIILVFYFTIVKGDSEKTLLIIWSLVMLVAIWGQRRFAYYFAVNVALLASYLSILIYNLLRWLLEFWRGERTGYMSWQILELDIKAVTRPKELQPTELQPKSTTKRARKLERRKARKLEIKQARMKRRQETGIHLVGNYLSIGLSAIIIFFVVFSPLAVFPSVKSSATVSTASGTPYAPSDAWCSALSWMKDNTPEPFGNPDAYYQRFAIPSGGENFTYPESAYGVMAWWDYGYWITRIAHRIPNANPSQDPLALNRVANYFVAQDESSANNIAKELGTGYVIVDYEIAITYFNSNTGTVVGKFYAMATWAGKQSAEFFEFYYVPQQDGGIVPYLLFYPEYYRSTAVRLYNFDGKAVIPTANQTIVISYQEVKDAQGNLFKVIDSVSDNFTSYEEAEAYVANQTSGNYRIIGVDPMVSPVPLEALSGYKLVFGSDNINLGSTSAPAIKIFEFTDRVPPRTP